MFLLQRNTRAPAGLEAVKGLVIDDITNKTVRVHLQISILPGQDRNMFIEALLILMSCNTLDICMI